MALQVVISQIKWSVVPAQAARALFRMYFYSDAHSVQVHYYQPVCLIPYALGIPR